MAVTTSPQPLLPATRALCRREPYDATDEALTLGQVPGRLGLAVLILVGATLLGWVLPARHTVTPEAQWLGSFAVGVLVAGSYLYGSVWRPLFHSPRHYRLVGEFAVREKFEAFGRRLLRIGPGGEQHVRVGAELYERLQVGDQVRVIYTADGDLVSIARWAGVPGR